MISKTLYLIYLTKFTCIKFSVDDATFCFDNVKILLIMRMLRIPSLANNLFEFEKSLLSGLLPALGKALHSKFLTLFVEHLNNKQLCSDDSEFELFLLRKPTYVKALQSKQKLLIKKCKIFYLFQ